MDLDLVQFYLNFFFHHFFVKELMNKMHHKLCISTINIYNYKKIIVYKNAKKHNMTRSALHICVIMLASYVFVTSW